MKWMPHLKKGLILYSKDALMLLLSFILFPLALSFMYGSMQEDLFEGRNHSIEAVEASFEYDKASDKGAVFKGILSDESVEEMIHSTGLNPKYYVVVDEDFKGAQIKGEDEGAVQFIILKNFVETVLSDFGKYDLVQKTVGGLVLSEAQKGDLVNKIMNSINQNNRGTVIKETIIEGYKTLNSNEYYTISVFSFTFMLLITTLAGYFYKEVKEGIVKRTLSTPNDKRGYFLGFILNSFIASVVISVIYVGINRLRGVAFTGNPLHIGLIILLQSLLCASVVGIVIAFIKKEMTASVLTNLLLIVPSIFGGAFFYNELIESPGLKVVVNATPNALILNAYKDLAITESMQEISGELIVMLGLSIVLLMVSIIKIQRKWEV